MTWLKQNSLPLILGIVLAVGGFRLYDWIWGDAPETQFVTDNERVARAEAERDKALSENSDLAFKLKKALGTRTPAEPIRVVSGKIERPIEFKTVEDTVRQTKTRVPTLDVILYGVADGDEVSMYVVNLYAELLGSDARKVYTWERKSPDFYFAVRDMGGISMTFKRDFLRFDGFYAGLGFDLDKPYGLLEARVLILETVELSAYLNTQPGIGIVGKLKL